ncbi:MAG: RHS repeat-associated core domain-containing protein [Candidatus Riflebacteria bacterium]|nr:RHS repeat-associated core domain-containing protein [Candidatus Riflebacteria bacterium]
MRAKFPRKEKYSGMKNKSFKWLLWVIIALTLIPSCISANISQNSRQGFERNSSNFQPGSTASLSAFTAGFLDWDNKTRVGHICWGNFRWPDKKGYGVAPCREDDLDDLLDRLEGKFSLGGCAHDFWWHGKYFAKTMTPYLFTGRRYSTATELYFNRHRYYSPQVGRFISKDPIGFNGGKNLWGYVKNNPLRFVDPFGKQYRITSTAQWSYLNLNTLTLTTNVGAWDPGMNLGQSLMGFTINIVMWNPRIPGIEFRRDCEISVEQMFKLKLGYVQGELNGIDKSLVDPDNCDIRCIPIISEDPRMRATIWLNAVRSYILAPVNP